MANNNNTDNTESNAKKRICLYTGSGAAGLGLKTLPKILEQHDLICSSQLPNDLEDYDIIVFPGGGAASMLRYLIQQQQESRLKELISNGLGYVGICAGAYLGALKTDCPRFPSGLGLLNVECRCAGHGKTKKGGTKLLLPNGTKKLVGFNQGPVFPLLSESQVASEGDFGVVASFGSEMGVNSLSTIGQPAIIEGFYGQGKVMLISPHPEQAQGLEKWTHDLILSTAM